MPRFALVFAALLAGLFALELTGPVQRAFVIPWTEGLARASAWIATAFDGDVASQARLLYSRSTGFGVLIEAGCNGVEAALILTAAILAFRAPWRHKAIGILAGLAAVQGLNVVRVISLFYLGMWNAKAFEWAHLYLWQALIMLDILVVWLLWLRALPQRRPAAGGTAPA